MLAAERVVAKVLTEGPRGLAQVKADGGSGVNGAGAGAARVVVTAAAHAVAEVAQMALVVEVANGAHRLVDEMG